MTPTPRYIQTVYLVLMLLSTLAASFIWGINTLFLLSAGLTNTEAFLANTFFTLGEVIFEVPTGIVADMSGRRTSYLLGTITLAISTAIYLAAWYIHAPLALWAISSILLGLGFTFFSGATEAWLVDALKFADYKGSLESIFAKGQMVAGVAMLVGSVAGGVVAQMTNLSVPYMLRSALLLVTFVIAFVFMKDWGFKPTKSVNIGKDIKQLFTSSFNFSWQRPAIRWVMIAGPFISGVSIYTFYALQPFLLKLYGNEKAYAIAGLAAAIVAGAQIVGSMAVPYLKNFFKLRTSIFITAISLVTVILILVGLTSSFWVAIALLCAWGLVGAMVMPVRQAYLNSLIPSEKRATVLSFDSLVSSSGGAIIQPGLGRAADISSYGTSFIIGALVQAVALPFTYLAKKTESEADKM